MRTDALAAAPTRACADARPRLPLRPPGSGRGRARPGRAAGPGGFGEESDGSPLLLRLTAVTVDGAVVPGGGSGEGVLVREGPLPSGSAPPGVLLPGSRCRRGQRRRDPAAAGVLLPGSRCRRGQRRRGPPARGPAAAGISAAGVLLPGSCCRRGQRRRGPASAGVSAAGILLPPGVLLPGSRCRRGSAPPGSRCRRGHRRRGSRCRRGPAARTGARWRGPLGGLSVGKGCPEAAVPISERSGPPREQQPAGEQGGRRPPACLRLGSVTGVCPGPHAGGKRGPPWEWTFPNLRLLCVIGRSPAGSWNCSDSLFLRPRAWRGFVHLPARSCSSGGRQLSSLPDTPWFPIEKDEEVCLHSVLTSSQWAGAGGPAPTPLPVPCQCTWPYHCYFACLTCDGSKTVTSAATSTRWDPYLPVTANEMRDAQLNQSAPLLGPRTGIGTTILSRLAVRSEME
ncbi:basic proline-rich protein-like [Mustela nigripes]|uniref:basic proline-rich protein-like n=1 Tax=Mustela nigripes TaxID=77151 RepID=UPI002815D722|nr:basic proline-rich protein-like [Mustela nigripes]